MKYKIRTGRHTLTIIVWSIYVIWFFFIAISLLWNLSNMENLFGEIARHGVQPDLKSRDFDAILNHHLNKEILVHAGIFIFGLIMLTVTMKLIRQRRIERRKNNDLLSSSEAKYRMLFEGNPLPMWVYDMNTLAFLAVNDFAIDQYGFSKEEFLNMTIKEIRPPEDIPYLHEVLNTYTGMKRKVGTARHRKKDGSIIIVDITGHEIQYEGKRAMLVLSKDITEQKLAEKKIEESLHEKSILLSEIHHRVKNNMQLISSLLQLQSMKIEDEKIRIPFSECENRIRSMALVHEKLYQSENMASINFIDYLDSLMNDIYLSSSIYREEIACEIIGENINLGLEKAIPCGLLITELTLNAIKHAFPEKRNGKLTIRFEKDDIGYSLAVNDNGIGLPNGIDINKSNTLGFQLVSVLTKQLNGTLNISRESGTQYIITFPE